MSWRGHNVVKLEAPLKPKNGGSKYPHTYVLPLDYMTDNVSTSLANASGKDLGTHRPDLNGIRSETFPQHHRECNVELHDSTRFL